MHLGPLHLQCVISIPSPMHRSTSRPNFSQASSCIAIVYQSFCSSMIADWLNYDWIAGKKLDGHSAQFLPFLYCYALPCSALHASRQCQLLLLISSSFWSPFTRETKFLRYMQYLMSSRPNFSQPSSRIALVYQSVHTRTIPDRL